MLPVTRRGGDAAEELVRCPLSEPRGEADGEGLATVLPFVRNPRHAASSASFPVVVNPGLRSAPEAVRSARWALLLTASAAAHLAFALAFWRAPAPLASTGEAAISVELVLGSQAPAGLAAVPAEADTAAPPSVAPAEPPTAQPIEPVTAETPPPEAEVSSAPPPEEAPAPVTSAAPPTSPDEASPLPEQVQAVTAEQPRPDEQPASTDASRSTVPTQATAAPAPPEVVAVEKPAPVPPPKAATKPSRPKAAQPPAKPTPRVAEPRRQHARETARQAPTPAPRREAKPRARATASGNGVGVGRSDVSSNYRGIVAAHLARYKQYPAAARGSQGTVGVAFSLSGSGTVTGVSLTRASGVPGFDQEALAMVRRASPFPPPPDGRMMRFSVPVTFRPQ